MFIHPTADVSERSTIGEATRIWHQAQVMPDARIGAACTLGKGCFVGTGSIVGNKVKIGNYAEIFGAVIEDEAFIGPLACLIEDSLPRSTNLDGSRRELGDWTKAPARICRGASVGAGSIILPGIIVGAWSMTAAGSVVHRNVPPHVLVGGNPARSIGFVCRCGARLIDDSPTPTCVCGSRYARLLDGLTTTQGI